MKNPSASGGTVHQRLLAMVDEASREGDVTASRLAGRLSLPVAEVEVQLKALVKSGDLTQRSTNGEAHYAAAPRRKPIGALLVEAGYITPAQLQQALDEEARTGEQLSSILLDRGYVSKQALGQMLGAQHGVAFIDLSAYPIDEQVLRRLPEGVIMHHKVLPVARDAGRVCLAMVNPTDVMAIDTVARLLGSPVLPFLIVERDFDWAVTRYFDVGRRVGESLLELPVEDRAAQARPALTLSDTQDDAPVVRVVNAIINEAVRLGATDIHIEPELDQARVRVRVDGVLSDRTTLPRGMAASVASRLKVLAGMDIAERVRPQDGRLLLNIEGREYDLRIATVGTAFGERVAIRLLSTRHIMVGFDRLGLFPEQQDVLRRLLVRQHGMILVTGPTGSGKTTTLYASLSYANERTRNIMTVEDPVEYRVAGITQIPVREKAGITFEVGLRAILRHDPDVVMVGEIRDPETASIAVQAALTGHLVLTTLHTNNAAGALVRLVNMGVEPYLLTSTILAIVGQRLIRTLCQACRHQVQARPEDLRILGLPPDQPVTLMGPAGCPECGNLAYKGRTGIFEIMEVTSLVRDAVLQHKPATAVMEAAQAAGMRTLRDSAVRKVLDGVTSIAELERFILTEAS
jgi:type IV pilus assembly protein PilB